MSFTFPVTVTSSNESMRILILILYRIAELLCRFKILLLSLVHSIALVILFAFALVVVSYMLLPS